MHRSRRWEGAERDGGSSSAGHGAGALILKTSKVELQVLVVVVVGGVALSSGVAWHLTLFTAIECRVVEEGAAFTVPMGAFKVFVPLGGRRRWHGLGGLVSFWDTRQRRLIHRGKGFDTSVQWGDYVRMSPDGRT